MIFRMLVFLVGFGITSISLSYIILYLNLLSFGYNFFEYVKFISRRFECLMVFLGVIMMVLSVIINGGKNELYL